MLGLVLAFVPVSKRGANFASFWMHVLFIARLSFITCTHTHNHTRTIYPLSCTQARSNTHIHSTAYNSFVFTVLPNLWKCINNQVLEIKCEEQYNKKLVFYGHFIFLQYIYYMQMWSSIFFLFCVFSCKRNYRRGERKATIIVYGIVWVEWTCGLFEGDYI